MHMHVCACLKLEINGSLLTIFPPVPDPPPFQEIQISIQDINLAQSKAAKNQVHLIKLKATLLSIYSNVLLLKCALSRLLIKLFVPQSCQPDRASGRNYEVI